MVANLYSGTTITVMRAAFGPFISWMVLIMGLLLMQQEVAAIASKEGDGPPSCPLPDNVTEWRDDPPKVTIEWAYGEVVCSSVDTCFGNDGLPNSEREPQLKPVEIQAGSVVIISPNTNKGITFPIHPFRVDLVGFKTCNTSMGTPIVFNGTLDPFTIRDEFLWPGNNYFIVDSQHPLVRCEFGLRINITVKENTCSSTNSTHCDAQGYCVTRTSDPDYYCDCCAGFSGSRCNVKNPCLESPCHNGGTCTHVEGNGSTSYNCTCAPEFTGTRCEINICDLLTCENNGTCRTNGSVAACVCSRGFAGEYCELDVNECMSNPCVHGVCVDIPNGYQCYCTPGYYGANCHYDYNECLSNPCKNGGVCRDIIDGYQCQCPKMYTGRDCSVKVHPCKMSPCGRNMRCIEIGDHYTCKCISGYKGILCQHKINACESYPCKNGGICHQRRVGFKCDCGNIYAGHTCELPIDVFPPPYEIGLSDDRAYVRHIHNLYIVGGTLAGALLIVLVILAGCYCRVYETYKLIHFRHWKYSRQSDENNINTYDVSSVTKPRPSIDAIWDAASDYNDQPLYAPTTVSLKARIV